MPYVNLKEERKNKENSINIIKKFLLELREDVEVETYKGLGIDLIMSFGRENKKAAIFVLSGKEKATNMFIGAYTTKSIRGEKNPFYKTLPCYLYTTKAHFLMFLAGKRLYILPMTTFRKWVNDHTNTFQVECYTTISGGYEIKSHGYLVPLNRLRRDFIKGNKQASVYYIDDDPNSDKIRGYIQEM